MNHVKSSPGSRLFLNFLNLAILSAFALPLISAQTAQAAQAAMKSGLKPGQQGQQALAAEEEEYDRLDGVGKSGKRVDVIEWEGNLEIHVYPKNSLRGLSLKLDKRNKDKPVMVIGYRLQGSAAPLIRRAILGVPFQEGFKTYRDLSEADFDKIIISNNGLSGHLAEFRLDAAPAQLYPDGSPENGASSPSVARLPAAEELSAEPRNEVRAEVHDEQKHSPARKSAVRPNESIPISPAGSNDDGAIKAFNF
ncbi:MAG: hypothetical protein H7222_06820 [Methylotenera sp.]|nr:hypothetical protein [Oligoflexia bacterium]